MVEYTAQLDLVFGSLSDPIRRDILKRVARRELTVNAIAHCYRVSLAAISKHLKILERAKLVSKRKEGREHYVKLLPVTLEDAREYLEHYQALWESRLDASETYSK